MLNNRISSVVRGPGTHRCAGWFTCSHCCCECGASASIQPVLCFVLPNCFCCATRVVCKSELGAVVLTAVQVLTVTRNACVGAFLIAVGRQCSSIRCMCCLTSANCQLGVGCESQSVVVGTTVVAWKCIKCCGKCCLGVDAKHCKPLVLWRGCLMLACWLAGLLCGKWMSECCMLCGGQLREAYVPSWTIFVR